MTDKKIVSKRVVSPTQKAFNVWGLILIAWAFYRSTYGLGMPVAIDELIIKPLLFVVPVLYYIKHFEHKDLIAGLWLYSKSIWKDIQFGLILSIPLIAFFAYIALFQNKNLSWSQLPIIFIVAFAMSISEEILSRGFVARHIWQETHSVVKTIIQASLLYIFLRIPHIMTMPEIFGQKLIWFFLAELLVAVTATGIYLWRRSLITVIIVRTIYSFILMTMLLQ